MTEHIFTPVETWDHPERLDFAQDFPPARVFGRKGSFVWWWWMFMFREGGVRKQIVAFWTTKTYPKVVVNGEEWGPAADIRGTRESFSYNGMSTWWFWDGERFHETVPRVSRFHTRMWEGGFSIRSDDVTNLLDRGSFELRFCRDAGDFDLHIDHIDPLPPPVGYKRTLITRRMGFDQMKVYQVDAKGSLTAGGESRRVEGTLYAQHICLNTPAIPWLWGTFHRDNGGYLTYFTSFIGPLMFRRRAECKPAWDNRFRFINRNLHYTTNGKDVMRFQHVKFKVIRDERGLPGFEVSGAIGDERLRVRVSALAKTTYEFRRTKLWRNRFFYNEFPSEIVELEHIDADGKVHRDDPAAWTGNSEYSWGILLN
ncbi:MAG: hypothetical protein L0Z54_01405 [Thermoplasmata archaeon]|nr:hypothetical protein [Thermoplasmata archaeon]